MSETKSVITSPSPPISSNVTVVSVATSNKSIVSIPHDLFIGVIPSDYYCVFGDKEHPHVPIDPITPECCGAPCCKECYLTGTVLVDSQPINDDLSTSSSIVPEKLCIFCKKTAQSTIPSPFLTLKIGAERIKCPNYDRGCTIITVLGKRGIRLFEHLNNKCEYEMIKCNGCHGYVQRNEMDVHRGDQGMDGCLFKPVTCPFCEMKVSRTEMDIHTSSAEHHKRMLTRFSQVLIQFEKQKLDLEELKKHSHQNEITLKEANTKITETLAAVEARFTLLNDSLTRKIKMMETSQLSVCLTFDISNWSKIPECKGADVTNAIYSSATPLRSWGYEWWFKVVKEIDGNIGLFLCCGQDETVNSSISTKWPILVDYQLMTRRRNTDDAVSRSEGAYIPSEDKLTFGCTIAPIKGVHWISFRPAPLLVGRS